ncbi:MAG: glycosyltransferase family 4 protein, partial [Planctomycetes bacterium]|nr:glycosyltransferase family 4 protein [Planctomycetota bacterium]
MRVLVNTMCTLATRSGVGHHTSEVVAALRARTEPGTIGTYPSGVFLPCNRWLARQAERYLKLRERGGVLARAEATVRRGLMAVGRRAGRLLVRNPLDYCARRGAYDLYHEPNTLAVPCSLPLVITVHDLSVLLHPEWHPPRRVQEYEWQFRDSLNRSAHVLAVSEFTKRELVRELGYPAERVSVTYNGRRPFLRPLSAPACAPTLLRLGLQPGYLLHVGTVEPRKNIATLLRAHDALPTALRHRHPLVLVGGTGWRANDLERALADRQRDGTVRRLGYCPDGDLAALYSSARALVFPTLYEGFGMPTVEMLACGGAVLASDTPAVAETVGTAA